MRSPLTLRAVRVGAVAAAMTVGAAGAVVSRAVAQQNQNFDAVQMDVQQVSGNVYMVVGQGGNTTVFTGPEGVLVVDTQFAPLSGKLLDAIKKLSDQPIRWIVNTHMHDDHVGGNEAIARAWSGRTCERPHRSINSAESFALTFFQTGMISNGSLVLKRVSWTTGCSAPATSSPRLALSPVCVQALRIRKS